MEILITLLNALFGVVVYRYYRNIDKRIKGLADFATSQLGVNQNIITLKLHQDKVNADVLRVLNIHNADIRLLQSRLNAAGTKIIELDCAILTPDLKDEEIN